MIQVHRSRNRRVLVVDDVPAIHRDFRKSPAGGSAAPAKVASVLSILSRQVAAAEAVRSHDLVLMDDQIPALGGLAATGGIRARANLAGLAVIAMMASVLPSSRRRCIEAGMSDCIDQPLDSAALWAVLLRWLPRPAQPAVAAEHAR